MNETQKTTVLPTAWEMANTILSYVAHQWPEAARQCKTEALFLALLGVDGPEHGARMLSLYIPTLPDK